MKRRDFLVFVGGSLLAIPTVLRLTACGGSDDDNGGADAAQATSFVGSATSGGHPHMFTVNCADLTMTSVTYTATGSGHTHSVTLTSTQLANLAAGMVVELATTDGHPLLVVGAKTDRRLLAASETLALLLTTGAGRGARRHRSMGRDDQPRRPAGRKQFAGRRRERDAHYQCCRLRLRRVDPLGVRLEQQPYDAACVDCVTLTVSVSA